MNIKNTEITEIENKEEEEGDGGNIFFGCIKMKKMGMTIEMLKEKWSFLSWLHIKNMY